MPQALSEFIETRPYRVKDLTAILLYELHQKNFEVKDLLFRSGIVTYSGVIKNEFRHLFFVSTVNGSYIPAPSEKVTIDTAAFSKTTAYFLASKVLADTVNSLVTRYCSEQ